MLAAVVHGETENAPGHQTSSFDNISVRQGNGFIDIDFLEVESLQIKINII
jgi:hypothetical protein